MERRLSLTATLTTAGTVTPPIGPVPPETIEQAIERLVRERNEYAEKLCERNAALVMAPDVEAAIAQIVACTDLMDNAGSARAREALRAAIAADKARAVAAAIEGTGRAEQFADAICHRVGARDSGCGGQTVEAGTARLYADAAKRIDDLIARDKARPTPDEARRLVDEYDRATRNSYVTGGPEALRAARTALISALTGKDQT